MLTGSCLCQGIRFTVSGPVQGPSVCHCTQCRKLSGFAWSSAYAPTTAIDINGDVR